MNSVRSSLAGTLGIEATNSVSLSAALRLERAGGAFRCAGFFLAGVTDLPALRAPLRFAALFFAAAVELLEPRVRVGFFAIRSYPDRSTSHGKRRRMSSNPELVFAGVNRCSTA